MQLTRVNAAVTSFRRHWWGLLADRPQGFPWLATCDNTDDMLAIDPRPGGATSNCAKDNIALLDLAVSRHRAAIGVGCWYG